MVCVCVLGCLDRTWQDAPVAKYKMTETTAKPDGTRTTRTTEHEALGPALSTPDPKTIQTPQLEVTAEGASVGRSKLKFNIPSGIVILYYFAGFMVVAGLALGYFFSWTLGLAIIGTALVLILVVHLIEEYALYLLGLGVLAIVGAAAYLIYRARQGKSAETTLATVAAAVKVASGKAQAQVKAAVAAIAGEKKPAVDSDIEKAKESPTYKAAVAGASATSVP